MTYMTRRTMHSMRRRTTMMVIVIVDCSSSRLTHLLHVVLGIKKRIHIVYIVCIHLVIRHTCHVQLYTVCAIYYYYSVAWWLFVYLLAHNLPPHYAIIRGVCWGVCCSRRKCTCLLLLVVCRCLEQCQVLAVPMRRRGAFTILSLHHDTRLLTFATLARMPRVQYGA